MWASRMETGVYTDISLEERADLQILFCSPRSNWTLRRDKLNCLFRFYLPGIRSRLGAERI